MKALMIALTGLSLLASAPSHALNLKYSCSNKKDRLILTKLAGNRFGAQIPPASASSSYDWRGTLEVDTTVSASFGAQYSGAIGAHALKPGVNLPKALYFYSVMVPSNMINGTPGENGMMGGTVLVRTGGSPVLKYTKFQCAAIAD